jgi:hypothetical protein
MSDISINLDGVLAFLAAAALALGLLLGLLMGALSGWAQSHRQPARFTQQRVFPHLVGIRPTGSMRCFLRKDSTRDENGMPTNDCAVWTDIDWFPSCEVLRPAYRSKEGRSFMLSDSFEVRPKATRNGVLLALGCVVFTFGGLWMIVEGEGEAILAGLLNRRALQRTQSEAVGKKGPCPCQILRRNSHWSRRPPATHTAASRMPCGSA